MKRREFVRLCSGIITGLGLHGVSGDCTGAEQEADTRVDGDQSVGGLDDSYLVRGLTGMARAKGWFDAHWGAAVIAGYYLCKENKLDDETVSGIKSQLDAAIKLRSEQFAPLPDQDPDEALIERVPKAMAPAVEGGLRAHGHAVIFASMSTKALRDVPWMARPALIDSLCGLSQQIARKAPQRPKDRHSATYPNTQAMIDALFDSLARFEPLLGRPSVRRPNFTHMTTHTEALMNLDLMGYRELAKAGHPGHAVHIAAEVPEVDPSLHPQKSLVSLESITNADYWQDEENRAQWNQMWGNDNPNGYWIAAGHLFKVLYSYHRLIARVEDKEKVRLCSRILLERYFNPDVQGG